MKKQHVKKEFHGKIKHGNADGKASASLFAKISMVWMKQNQ